jgi:hypothetical protein
MNGPDEPPSGASPRRRAPWSFKNLVEDVSGRPLSDFQEPPPRPVAGPLRSAPVASPPAGVPLPVAAVDAVEVRPAVAEADLALDPVARIYPPLAGATGRSLHGAEAEHHEETLRSVESPEERAGMRAATRAPGPSRRPERIYLHYLLLHLDRLHDPALRYLKHAVDEELTHREQAAAGPAEAPVPAPQAVPLAPVPAAPDPPAPVLAPPAA